MKINNSLYALFILLLTACSNSKKNDLVRLVGEWNNREILFFSNMPFVLYEENKAPSQCQIQPSQYIIVSYIDSVGCMSCKLQLPSWKEFINQVDSIFSKKTSILFFVHPNNKKELEYILKRDNFDYPVCIDEKDSLNKLNHFPSDMAFQTFLLDKNNRVLAIGNPIHNPKVKELYLKIIRGEDVEMNQNQKLVKTEVHIVSNSLSLGRFAWNEEQKTSFVFVNKGNAPFIIEDVSTSCGCTSVEYSKAPVQPGDSIRLQVMYKADHPEYFNKTITVYSNATSSPVRLQIKGDAQ